MSSIMRCRSGLMALSVIGDAPVLMEVVETPSQDRTPRGAILFAVPPAAANYRASGLVRWREAVVRPGANAFDRYGLAYRRRGSALKYDFAAHYRYVGLDVLDLILRHGHAIRRENHQVGQLSGLKRTLPPFFERVTCSRTRIEAQSLFAADGFGCAVNVAIGVLPRHHDVHVEER